MTAQKLAASQTATQRKNTGRLARHFKLSVLASMTASGKEKRQQAVCVVRGSFINCIVEVLLQTCALSSKGRML